MSYKDQPDLLIETIMAKGIQAHYSPEVLSDAERLYKVWERRFRKSASPWPQLSHGMRIAFCEMVIEARKFTPKSVEVKPDAP